MGSSGSFVINEKRAIGFFLYQVINKLSLSLFLFSSSLPLSWANRWGWNWGSYAAVRFTRRWGDQRHPTISKGGAISPLHAWSGDGSKLISLGFLPSLNLLSTRFVPSEGGFLMHPYLHGKEIPWQLLRAYLHGKETPWEPMDLLKCPNNLAPSL